MIELTGISKSHGGLAALDDVSLSVEAGAFVALVGPSGSGKTTLLKTINRLVEPDQGEVRIRGEDWSGPPAELRRNIGYAFQGIGLFPHMSVAENIEIVPKLAGMPEAGRRAQVAELLRLVALPEDFAGRSPASLSGGQAQRVGLARALAGPLQYASHGPTPQLLPGEKRSGLILLDEPFGALDPVTRDELGAAYRALHDRLGLTTIMVTHDMAEALLLADRILVLIGGRIRADAAPGDLIGGHGDAEVAALIDVPRRQAERLAALRGGV